MLNFYTLFPNLLLLELVSQTSVHIHFHIRFLSSFWLRAKHRDSGALKKETPEEPESTARCHHLAEERKA